jgi:hypothetical protein
MLAPTFTGTNPSQTDVGRLLHRIAELELRIDACNQEGVDRDMAVAQWRRKARTLEQFFEQNAWVIGSQKRYDEYLQKDRLAEKEMEQAMQKELKTKKRMNLIESHENRARSLAVACGLQFKSLEVPSSKAPATKMSVSFTKACSCDGNSVKAQGSAEKASLQADQRVATKETGVQTEREEDAVAVPSMSSDMCGGDLLRLMESTCGHGPDNGACSMDSAHSRDATANDREAETITDEPPRSTAAAETVEAFTVGDEPARPEQPGRASRAMRWQFHSDAANQNLRLKKIQSHLDAMFSRPSELQPIVGPGVLPKRRPSAKRPSRSSPSSPGNPISGSPKSPCSDAPKSPNSPSNGGMESPDRARLKLRKPFIYPDPQQGIF